LFNAGSVRVDDLLTPPLTQYDIIRTLPFGGGIREAEMKGKLLLQVLNAGQKNKGIGGFLHYSPVQFDAVTNTWILNGKPIDANQTYRVAMPDFLFSGKEANLEFLNKDNPLIVKTYEAETSTKSLKSDIRLAIVKYLEKK
jgi:2',3'-cyclic-nucleotide 2'-phosphodiesterase (5'-nucleotidase family)